MAKLYALLPPVVRLTATSDDDVLTQTVENPAPLNFFSEQLLLPSVPVDVATVGEKDIVSVVVVGTVNTRNVPLRSPAVNPQPEEHCSSRTKLSATNPCTADVVIVTVPLPLVALIGLVPTVIEVPKPSV